MLGAFSLAAHVLPSGWAMGGLCCRCWPASPAASPPAVVVLQNSARAWKGRVRKYQRISGSTVPGVFLGWFTNSQEWVVLFGPWGSAAAVAEGPSLRGVQSEGGRAAAAERRLARFGEFSFFLGFLSRFSGRIMITARFFQKRFAFGKDGHLIGTVRSNWLIHGSRCSLGIPVGGWVDEVPKEALAPEVTVEVA